MQKNIDNAVTQVHGSCSLGRAKGSDSRQITRYNLDIVEVWKMVWTNVKKSCLNDSETQGSGL